MAPYLLQFTAALLIVGFTIRYIETTWPESTFVKALLFIY